MTELRWGLASLTLITCAPCPALAATSPSTNAAETSSERSNWRVRTAWIKELDGDEQIVVLLLIRSALNEKLFELLKHNGERRDENFRWILGTQAWGNFLLSELATKDAELRGLFKQVADGLLPIYLGKQQVSTYVGVANITTQRLAKRLSELDLKRAQVIADNYSQSIERSSGATVVTAMQASLSGIKKSKH